MSSFEATQQSSVFVLSRLIQSMTNPRFSYSFVSFRWLPLLSQFLLLLPIFRNQRETSKYPAPIAISLLDRRLDNRLEHYRASGGTRMIYGYSSPHPCRGFLLVHCSLAIFFCLHVLVGRALPRHLLQEHMPTEDPTADLHPDQSDPSLDWYSKIKRFGVLLVFFGCQSRRSRCSISLIDLFRIERVNIHRAQSGR